jgi:hypothetical protein
VIGPAVALALTLGAPGLDAAAAVRAGLAADRWEQALVEAERAMAADPGPDVRAALGEALYRAGRLRQAAEVLDPLEALPGVTARGHLALGRLRVAQGRDTDGIAHLEAALQARPDDPEIVLAAAGAAPTRAEAVARLTRFLDLTRAQTDQSDRIEGAKGTVALYRALGERPVWQAVTRPQRLRLPLRELPGPAGSVRGYVIEADLGGKRPVRLLLDSGSPGLFLVGRIARGHGLQPLADTTVFGGGGGGRQQSSTGLLPGVGFGSDPEGRPALLFRDALVTTGETELDPTGRFHGVLGLQTFAGWTLVLDLKGRSLALEPAGTPAPGALPYWTVGGQWLVEAGDQRGTTGLFLLDTGADRSIVSPGFATASGARPRGNGPPVRIYGSPVPGTRLVRGLQLGAGEARSDGGPVPVVDLAVRSRMGGVEIAGFLGLDVLAGRRLVIDPGRRRLRL